MQRNSYRRLRQTGDTIVEVLIAIAITGAVMAGAFTVSQKSVIAVRSSQEHGEVLQLLQGQVELVRVRALDESNAVSGIYATSPKFFCINDTTKQRANQPRLGNALPDRETDSFETYEDACKFGPNKMYSVAISYNPATRIFTFVCRWDRLGGGTNQEQLVYRITPGRAIPTVR